MTWHKRPQAHPHQQPPHYLCQHTRHYPDAGLGIVLLLAGHTGWLYGPRHRHFDSSRICRFFGGAHSGGLAGPARWPLSTWLDLEYGWRSTCFVWAALHLFIGLPLNASLPSISGTPAVTDSSPDQQTSTCPPPEVASLADPLGAACLIIFGTPAAILLPVLHGAGNGILSIAKGTLPLVIFGPQGYGLRQGLIMVPARMAQAIAPFIFGMLMEKWGLLSLWATGLLGLASVGALQLLARSMKAVAPVEEQQFEG